MMSFISRQLSRRTLGRLLATGLLPGWRCEAGTADHVSLAAVPFQKVSLHDSFWAPRLATNARVTIRACFRKCEESGHIDNFRKAARQLSGEHVGTPFYDGPVYKTMEGAAYTLISNPDPELDRYLENLISVIRSAQESDGYLYTARTINPGKAPAASGPERWSNLRESHELFLAGHLYEAAVAHFQATGRRTLLDVAIRNADLVTEVFGPGKRTEVPGHEEIELALVRLYGVTGDRKYLEQARRFVAGRGRHGGRVPGGIPADPSYLQDHVSVLEQTSAVGHAVRAVYLYTAMSDIADSFRDRACGDACERLWNNVVGTKTYLTGGIGARAEGESFGVDYELPNETAYAETCASIGSVFWNHSMFLRTRHGKYLDVLERTLYNGLLSGVSVDGEGFFYPNVLASDGRAPFNMGAATRQPWFQVACCPTNIVRFLPSLPGYIYAQSANDLFVALYISSRATVQISGSPVQVEQISDYPWDGRIRIRVTPPGPLRFTLNLRLPGWASGSPLPGDLYRYAAPPQARPVLRVNGSRTPVHPEAGFLRLEREWRPGDQVQLDLRLEIRRVLSHDAVIANRGRVAVERGALVYCFEGADNRGTLARLDLPDGAPLRVAGRSNLAGGVVTLRAGAFTAIPYYAWSHRGPGEMAVWVRRA